MILAFVIICLHFVFDVYLQDGQWAETKSHNVKSLLKHTSVYSFCWMLVIPFMMKTGLTAYEYVEASFIFGIITFVIHTITDYFTSKRTSKLFKEGRFGSPIPNTGMFSMILFDQILHYAQLFLTFYFVYNLY